MPDRACPTPCSTLLHPPLAQPLLSSPPPPQISEGVYVAYVADATDFASAGVDIATYATRALAEADCNRQARCVGMKASGGSWKTFGGSLAPGVTSKVRVSGPAINPWIAEPSAS